MAQGGEHGVMFPTTHWSMVDRARAGGAGLDEFLGRYLPALKAYLLYTLRVRQQDVEDVLQSFVTDKIVTNSLMEHANRQRGRFRTFLITVLRNYTTNHRRWHQAQCRSQATAYGGEPDPNIMEIADRAGISPAIAFETAWVRQVLTQALDLMQRECQTTHQQTIWALFEARVVKPALDSTDPPPYDDLVRTLGFSKPGDAHNALTTAKRMLHRHLRNVVREYTRDPAEVDEELADLKKILSNTRA